VEDLEEPLATCEMCEAVTIRYVHYMEHPDHEGTLGVGRVCAEHMSEDKVGPSRRESLLTNAARRRSTWLTRKWRESAQGNSYINLNGYNVVVFPGWSFRIVKKNELAGLIPGEVSRKWFSPRNYRSEDEAKLGAFDMLEMIRSGEL
jgi:hypothetical protein